MVSKLLSIICSFLFILLIFSPVHGTVIDFEGYSSGTYIDEQYQGLGVTFDPGGTTSFLAPGYILNVSSDGIVAQFEDGVYVNKVEVDYFSSVDLTLEAYDANNDLIDSVTTSSGDGSFGLSTVTMIKKVIIHDDMHEFAIDNFSFSVPESSTLVLLVSCLFGLFVIRKKTVNI